MMYPVETARALHRAAMAERYRERPVYRSEPQASTIRRRIVVVPRPKPMVAV
jgi:hypothetical protein